MTPEAIDINETAQINRVHRSKRIGFCLFFPLSFFEIYCTIWVNQDYSRNFGDDLIKSCGLISLLKQGCSKPVTQGYAPMAFETPQMIEKPTTSLENLGQCSVTYTVEVFPAVKREPPVFVLVTSGPVTEHDWKEPNSIFLAPSPQVFIDINDIPLSWVFSRLRSPSSLSFPQRRDLSVP